MHLSDPRQMWMKLKNLFESQTTNRRLTLKNQFYSLRMTEKQSMEEHLRSVNSIVNQLANIGVLLPDEDLVDRVLMSLPSSWTFMRQLINARENPITYSGLEALLLQEDAMKTRIEAQEEVEEAMAVSQESRVGRGKGRSGRDQGRGVRGTPSRGSSKSMGGSSKSTGSPSSADSGSRRRFCVSPRRLGVSRRQLIFSCWTLSLSSQHSIVPTLYRYTNSQLKLKLKFLLP